MRGYYADLHVHVGRTEKGQPVKVAAAAGLTVKAIVAECLERKGIDLVGLVDCASPGVVEDLENLVRGGRAIPLLGGGLRVDSRLTILLAVELELACPTGGLAHFLGYLPTLEAARRVSAFLSPRLTNVHLSSQRARLTLSEWLSAVEAEGGVVLPAHAFTPYRSVYGSCTRRLSELLSAGPERFGGLELGLSADTELADRLAELENLTFLSNSDAHSPARIAREYNLLELAEPSFAEVVLALKRQGGRRVAANYGLDPRLGKYYRTFCLRCGSLARFSPPVKTCPLCGRADVVRGVLDRIEEVADYPHPRSPSHRPPYYHQVPLSFLPGVGPRTLERLLSAFGSEMAVLHRASPEDLRAVAGDRTAEAILAARQGRYTLQEGGGGRYGRWTGLV